MHIVNKASANSTSFKNRRSKLICKRNEIWSKPINRITINLCVVSKVIAILSLNNYDVKLRNQLIGTYQNCWHT